MRHNWLAALPLIRKWLAAAEDDPAMQVRIHKFAMRLWIVNAIGAAIVFYGWPAIWAQYSVFYVTFISLYANFATDYGALGGSLAAEAASGPAARAVPEDEC